MSYLFPKQRKQDFFYLCTLQPKRLTANTLICAISPDLFVCSLFQPFSALFVFREHPALTKPQK